MGSSSAAEVVLGHPDDDQQRLPLTTDGVQRWVWESRHGAMLIEVIGSEVLVNGSRVDCLPAS